MDFLAYISSSPLKDLFEGKVVGSPYEACQTSDLLRLLLLIEHGGAYLDLDVISIAKMPPVQFLLKGAVYNIGSVRTIIALNHFFVALLAVQV